MTCPARAPATAPPRRFGAIWSGRRARPSVGSCAPRPCALWVRGRPRELPLAEEAPQRRILRTIAHLRRAPTSSARCSASAPRPPRPCTTFFRQRGFSGSMRRSLPLGLRRRGRDVPRDQPWTLCGQTPDPGDTISSANPVADRFGQLAAEIFACSLATCIPSAPPSAPRTPTPASRPSSGWSSRKWPSPTSPTNMDLGEASSSSGGPAPRALRRGPGAVRHLGGQDPDATLTASSTGPLPRVSYTEAVALLEKNAVTARAPSASSTPCPGDLICKPSTNAS